MSANCADPGFGVEAYENDSFVMGRMTDHNRVDMPIVTTAIDAPALLKVGIDGKTLEELTDNTADAYAVLTCDKPAGVLRTSVFTQGDFNRTQMERVLADRGDTIDLDIVTGGNSRIFFKRPIFGGAE